MRLAADVFTVMRKELIEALGEWQSLYGLLFQLGCLLLIAGIVAPRQATTWSSPGQLFFLFSVWPSLVAAVYAGDAFAGERERKTLDTLYTTPISDSAIFGGKLAAALCVALAGAIASLSLAFVSAWACDADAFHQVGVRGLAVLLCGALAFGASITALATWVSDSGASARSAQQISSLLPMLFFGLISVLVANNGTAVDFHRLALVDAALLAVAAVALPLGIRALQRGRMRR